MEHMASEVLQCINGASFGGKSLLCYRGIKDSEFLFDDEQALHTFMTLTEEKKLDSPCTTYRVNKNHILDELQVVWNVDPDFEGNYVTDYQILQNEFTNDRTSWTDKYTTAMYSPSPSISTSRNEFQSLPDYIYKMAKTCDLHYLAIQRGESYYNMGHGMRCLAFSFLQGFWISITH